MPFSSPTPKPIPSRKSSIRFTCQPYSYHGGANKADQMSVFKKATSYEFEKRREEKWAPHEPTMVPTNRVLFKLSA